MTTWSIPTDELMTYLSADTNYGGVSMGWLTGRTVWEVAEVYDHKLEIHHDCDPWSTYNDLKDNGQEYPVHVGTAEEMGPVYGFDPMSFEGRMVLGNGHHRSAMLHYLHRPTILVTDRIEESGKWADLKQVRAERNRRTVRELVSLHDVELEVAIKEEVAA